jgi:hypothetical protein
MSSAPTREPAQPWVARIAGCGPSAVGSYTVAVIGVPSKESISTSRVVNDSSSASTVVPRPTPVFETSIPAPTASPNCLSSARRD